MSMTPCKELRWPGARIIGESNIVVELDRLVMERRRIQIAAPKKPRPCAVHQARLSQALAPLLFSAQNHEYSE
jgi:hypothetical protein